MYVHDCVFLWWSSKLLHGWIHRGDVNTGTPLDSFLRHTHLFFSACGRRIPHIELFGTTLCFAGRASFLNMNFTKDVNCINHREKRIKVKQTGFYKWRLLCDHFLTLECGTPTDLQIRVQTVNCRSLAG